MVLIVTSFIKEYLLLVVSEWLDGTLDVSELFILLGISKLYVDLYWWS